MRTDSHLHSGAMPDPVQDPADIAYRSPLADDAMWPPVGEVGHPNLKELMYSRLPADAVIADVGCGPGPFEYEDYAPRFIAFDAFDLQDATCLKPKDEFRRGRLDAFPLDDASCDAVVMGFILEHVTQPHLFLKEADRALRPGGWCYVAVPDHRSMEDRLFRLATRVAGSTRGPHIQRFTFENFTAMVKQHTILELQAWHELPASYLWMMHPRLRRFRRPWTRALKFLQRLGFDLLKKGNYQFLLRKPPGENQ